MELKWVFSPFPSQKETFQWENVQLVKKISYEKCSSISEKQRERCLLWFFQLCQSDEVKKLTGLSINPFRILIHLNLKTFLPPACAFDDDRERNFFSPRKKKKKPSWERKEKKLSSINLWGLSSFHYFSKDHGLKGPERRAAQCLGKGRGPLFQWFSVSASSNALVFFC